MIALTGYKDAFEATDWNNLINPSSNINEQVDTVSSYISFCVYDTIPTKTVAIFPDSKTWVTQTNPQPERESSSLALRLLKKEINSTRARQHLSSAFPWGTVLSSWGIFFLSFPFPFPYSLREFVEWCDNACRELNVNKRQQRKLAADVITTARRS